MENKLAEFIENQIREGKLFIIAEFEQQWKNSLGPAKLIATYSQDIVVKALVNKELKKIPKWIRKIFKISLLCG